MSCALRQVALEAAMRARLAPGPARAPTIDAVKFQR